MKLRRVCVYCASSRRCHERFFQAADTLGRGLARRGVHVIYGGGAVGLMGALADGVLAETGEITGIIPDFMKELEWQHQRVRQMEVVADMHTRKSRMIEEADAFIALPGGCGTFEELLEAITWKRLGLHTAPIIIANLADFYSPLLQQLEDCVAGGFMDERHLGMWTAAESIDEVLALIDDPPIWDLDARSFAAM